MHRVLFIRHGPIVGALLLALISANSARAEFILDDFDNPAEAVSPETLDEWIETMDVGPLNGTRRIRLAGDEEDLVGRLDVNISVTSTLTGVVDRLGSGPGGGNDPIVAVQSWYDFDAGDLTQGGVNDAIFLDFRQMESAISPTFLRLTAFDADLQEWFVVEMLPVPRNNVPFTLSFPFDALRDLRGNGDRTSRFEQITHLYLTIRVSRLWGGGPDPINFRMELDAIRVGAIQIPEPTSSVLCLLGTFSILVFFSFRWIRHPVYFSKEEKSCSASRVQHF